MLDWIIPAAAAALACKEICMNNLESKETETLARERIRESPLRPVPLQPATIGIQISDYVKLTGTGDKTDNAFNQSSSD